MNYLGLPPQPARLLQALVQVVVPVLVVVPHVRHPVRLKLQAAQVVPVIRLKPQAVQALAVVRL